ncbi:MAG: hypothetical protein GYB24_02095 [Rhodobacteraceae bacterium]|nr:hypothetical protein [Paracoccaceae bacterium]
MILLCGWHDRFGSGNLLENFNRSIPFGNHGGDGFGAGEAEHQAARLCCSGGCVNSRVAMSSMSICTRSAIP